MKQKNAIGKGITGLIVALVICLYFVIGAEVENRINMYTQQSFQYDLAAVVKVVYGFVGALLIRIGYGMAAGKKAKGKRQVEDQYYGGMRLGWDRGFLSSGMVHRFLALRRVELDIYHLRMVCLSFLCGT